LEDLRVAAFPRAQSEMADLTKFAQQQGLITGNLRGWDVPHTAECQRQNMYSFSEEELRQYFPLPKVLDGLFTLVHQLFGVHVRPVDGLVPVWNPEVRVFALEENIDTSALHPSPRAYFYLDSYARPENKRGGAWMAECVGRSATQVPVAYLACNQSPPSPAMAPHQPVRPSLMTPREVETLFHEFGHGLQHMLTNQTGLCAGIRGIEWDAVELPSQFMENFFSNPHVLNLVSAHVDTGQSVPSELVAKVTASKNHHAALMLLRQVWMDGFVCVCVCISVCGVSCRLFSVFFMCACISRAWN
jgi:oligopeptidase A